MEKLLFLKAQWSHLPVQGSEAWLASRRTRIGGSEIASAIGMSPYQKPAELIASKIGNKRIKSAACTFGRVFEPVAKEYIEEALACEIHELGAVPSTRFPMCYSPDGLVVLGDVIKLIEIKCPFRRSKLAAVPEHYECQVQAGMNILPCESTLFYQFRFRACRVADLGPSNRYNRWLHTESYKRCPRSVPLRWGFLHFDADCDLIDLGALEKETAHKLCFVDRLTPSIHWESKDLPREGYVLPWKLFDFSMVELQRDSGFLDRHAETLWETHRKLL